ncbi:MAG: hypothetical protein JXA46_00845 [Dehalococcoidales bacterium]|nr:hypothetical protein [Dehalococcoidales bacterium]
MEKIFKNGCQGVPYLADSVHISVQVNGQVVFCAGGRKWGIVFWGIKKYLRHLPFMKGERGIMMVWCLATNGPGSNDGALG